MTVLRQRGIFDSMQDACVRGSHLRDCFMAAWSNLCGCFVAVWSILILRRTREGEPFVQLFYGSGEYLGRCFE